MSNTTTQPRAASSANKNGTLRRIASYYKFKLNNVWQYGEEQIMVNIKGMTEDELLTTKKSTIEKLTARIKSKVLDTYGEAVAKTTSTKITPKEIENFKNRKVDKKANDKLEKARALVTALITYDPILYGRASADYLKTIDMRRKEYVLQGLMQSPESVGKPLISEKQLLTQDQYHNVGWPMYQRTEDTKFFSTEEVYAHVLRSIQGFEAVDYNQHFTFKEMCDSVVADYGLENIKVPPVSVPNSRTDKKVQSPISKTKALDELSQRNSAN